MIFLKLILFLFLATISLGAISLAPWVPTRKKDFKRICELAKLKKGEKLYELGCGDARLLFYAEKNYKIEGVGYEIALPVYLLAKIKSLFLKTNIEIKLKSFFNNNLGKADVVYVFGVSKTLSEKIKQKFKKDLKQGTRIISYSFPIKGWTPKIISKPTNKDLSIYLYVI